MYRVNDKLLPDLDSAVRHATRVLGNGPPVHLREPVGIYDVLRSVWIGAVTRDSDGIIINEFANWPAMATPLPVARVTVDEFTRRWILVYGSERLKKCLSEGAECGALYRDERLALERPGWVWESHARGKGLPPRNPSNEAFVLLEQARKIEPTAELVYWTVRREGAEGDRLIWRGCICRAVFLDRNILYGLPGDYLS